MERRDHPRAKDRSAVTLNGADFFKSYLDFEADGQKARLAYLPELVSSYQSGNSVLKRNTMWSMLSKASCSTFQASVEKNSTGVLNRLILNKHYYGHL